MLGLGRSIFTALGRGAQMPMMQRTIQPQQVFSGSRRYKHEYAPRFKKLFKAMKGRVPVRTGGSVKGSSLHLGHLGLRLKTNGVRMAAIQLQEASKVIQRQLRGTGAKFVTRFVCNIPVAKKGNQTRMGKGKGAFDHWAVRVPTGKVLFEIVGDVHEKVAREALRKAAEKLPGVCEVFDRNSQLRVSPTCLIDPPEKVNWEEKMQKTPTKKYANIAASKLPEYRLYRGR